MSRAILGIIALIIILGLVAGAASIGGRFTSSSVGGWYKDLKKPTWTPSGGVIGSVWTVLYVLIAVAAWLVWRHVPEKMAYAGLALWGLQLLLNVGWSFVFFQLRQPGGAVAEIVLLWLAILATMVAFFRVSTAAGALFVPYIAWVTFAGYLNYSVWRMNI